MPQILPINFECTRKGLVISEQDATAYQLPTLFNNDTLQIEAKLLKRIATTGAPLFQKFSLTGYSLYIGVGSAGAALAEQNAFTISSDGYSMTGNLALTTAGISALPDGSSSTFEVAFTAPDGSIYTGQFTVTIKKTVRSSGGLTTIAGDTAIGRAEASRTFLKKEGAAGEGFILTSPDGTQRVLITLANDGHLDEAPLT